MVATAKLTQCIARVIWMLAMHAMSSSVAAKRVAVKGNRQLYDNSSWDLVDAI